jgi:hypothetical protein
LHSNPALRKLYFIALEKDNRSNFLRVFKGCFHALEENKVNPFTKMRQWRSFPSVAPHCNIGAALRQGHASKPVDKLSPLG